MRARTHTTYSCNQANRQTVCERTYQPNEWINEQTNVWTNERKKGSKTKTLTSLFYFFFLSFVLFVCNTVPVFIFSHLLSLLFLLWLCESLPLNLSPSHKNLLPLSFHSTFSHDCFSLNLIPRSSPSLTFRWSLIMSHTQIFHQTFVALVPNETVSSPENSSAVDLFQLISRCRLPPHPGSPSPHPSLPHVNGLHVLPGDVPCARTVWWRHSWRPLPAANLSTRLLQVYAVSHLFERQSLPDTLHRNVLTVWLSTWQDWNRLEPSSLRK